MTGQHGHSAQTGGIRGIRDHLLRRAAVMERAARQDTDGAAVRADAERAAADLVAYDRRYGSGQAPPADTGPAEALAYVRRQWRGHRPAPPTDGAPVAAARRPCPHCGARMRHPYDTAARAWRADVWWCEHCRQERPAG